ncbi:DUF2533 family protein [Neobacillus terrae]|uniref:DUF2533 family protein n=1 Tax=Neobacillus terrae TaxID=3034837 RepID=UPI00140DF842|nr:DUF2533 family protein [Neobacillus terrae]NHM32538.1 DUF2533 family protein [Neobacillus terrae]
MSVHKDLAQHAEKQNKKYQRFLELNDLRETYIGDAVKLCSEGKPFSTDKINEITRQMNQINLTFIPEMKIVSTEMISDYVHSKK